MYNSTTPRFPIVFRYLASLDYKIYYKRIAQSCASFLGPLRVQDVNLDGVLCPISCRLQCMYCFLKCEGMADQGFEIDIFRLQ